MSNPQFTSKWPQIACQWTYFRDAQVLAVRKSARIGQRLQKKSKQEQESQVHPQKKQQRPEGQVGSKSNTNTRKRQRRVKYHEDPATTKTNRRTVRGTPKAATTTNVKATARTPSRATTKTPSRATTKTPTGASSKTPTKATAKTPSKATARTPSKTTARTPSMTTARKPSKTTARTSSKATTKTPTRASSKTPTKATAKTPTKATAKTPTKATAKTPTKAIARTLSKATAKTPSNATAKTPTKTTAKTPRPQYTATRTTKAKPQTPSPTATVTKKGSEKTSSSRSSKSSSNSSAKRTIKRKAARTGSTSPFGSKRVKTFDTPSTTPRRNQEQAARRKSARKKSPIQFDYGVPSPTETERDSVEDEDSPSQLPGSAAKRVVVAVTKQDQSVRIPLDPPKSFTFKSEQARKLWEAATKERAEQVREVIESADFVPDWLKRQLEGSLELSAAQKRSIIAEDKNRRAQGMLGWLRLEEKALDLDSEIKLSLKKEFADTDLRKCIASIDKLLTLPVDPLTLKKYPHLAMTPCSLQRYKGDLAQWTLSSQQEETFCSKREIIWEKAKALQEKYMTLFGIVDAKKYVEIFNQRLQEFQDSVSSLSEEDISILVHDPSSKKIARKKVSLT